MKNRTGGLLLIGISLLVTAICYGLERVIGMLEIGANYIKNGWGGVSINVKIPTLSLILILLTIIIGIYLLFKSDNY